MDPIPTLDQVLRNAGSASEILSDLLQVPNDRFDREYLHYSEIPDNIPPGRDRIWAAVKFRRAGTRMDLSPPLDLSVCRPLALQDLLLEIVAPIPEQGLSVGENAAASLDEAEVAVAEAIGLVQLGGFEPDPLDGTNLLRTGRPAQSDTDRELVAAYRGLSLIPGDRQGLSLSSKFDEQLEGVHPVLGAGLIAVARMRQEWRGALTDWRRALLATKIPEIRRMAVISSLDGDRLRHALACMESDEQDATYPLLVLLTALRDARQRLVAAAQARAERLTGLGTDPELNERQILVLDQVGRTPGFTTALAYHKQAFGVVYETARTDLQELARWGRLTMTRHGRAFHFTRGSGVPTPELARRHSTPPRRFVSPKTDDSLPVFF